MDSNRVEKRNRPPLSCEACRARKLKCNRELPCDTCVRRNRAGLCLYASNSTRLRGTPRSDNRKSGLVERLAQLEVLVSSILPSDDGQKKGSKPEDGRPPRTAAYVDENHWRAILESIHEVKEHLPGFSPGTTTGRPPDDELLLIPQSSTLKDILRNLPPQPMCDLLLSQYFNARFQILGIIHPARFQREYERFCNDPQQVSPLWLALLLAILAISAAVRQLCQPSSDASNCSVAMLQEQTTRCLVLGSFTTASAREYTLETLLLRMQTSFLLRRQNSPPTQLWFDMGTVLRQAVRLGYHRDPANLVGEQDVISVLEAEMRRRVWISTVQIDALLSFQMGLPSMVSAEWCDAQPPRNLQDADLDSCLTTLPPARPIDEHTPVQYVLSKQGVMSVFKKIVAHVQQARPKLAARTASLDTDMRAVYAAVPDTLQGRDVRRCTMDTSAQILDRCSIELLYLKGIIVLHRDAMESGEEPSRRTACVEAALAVLDRQQDLHEATQPGGRLQDDGWMLLSLIVHDFLLAAMVVCLDVSRRVQPSLDSSDLVAREYRALKASQNFWLARESVSSESHLALLALTLMLNKTEQHVSVAPAGTSTQPLFESYSGLLEPLFPDLELPYAEPMAHMIDGQEVLDWDLLDQYFQT